MTEDFKDREEREKVLIALAIALLSDFQDRYDSEGPSEAFWSDFRSELKTKLKAEITTTASLAGSDLADQLSLDDKDLSGKIDSWADQYVDNLSGELVQSTKDLLSSGSSSDIAFSESRAESIGVTETTAAIATGVALSAEENDLGQGIWHTEQDDQVCDDCYPLDGLPAFEQSPLHPNCRCWISYGGEEKSDLVIVKQETDDYLIFKQSN